MMVVVSVVTLRCAGSQMGSVVGGVVSSGTSGLDEGEEWLR